MIVAMQLATILLTAKAAEEHRDTQRDIQMFRPQETNGNTNYFPALRSKRINLGRKN
jgi:hypothetical protein